MKASPKSKVKSSLGSELPFWIILTTVATGNRRIFKVLGYGSTKKLIQVQEYTLESGKLVGLKKEPFSTDWPVRAYPMQTMYQDFYTAQINLL